MDASVLNLPAAARRLGAASPEELRRLARERKAERHWKKVAAGGRPIGVRPDDVTPGQWIAVLPRGMNVRVRGFETAAEAGFARDRMVLFLLGERAVLNHPRKSVIPASPATIRETMRRRRKLKTTSRYRGVQRAPNGSTFRAFVASGHCRTVHLGTWPTEREAAIAHDRAVLALGRPDSILNFPGLRSVRPASPAELRKEAVRLQKQRCTSRFRGVNWDPSRSRWRAHIAVGGRRIHLADCCDETDAALAYDEAARRLHGAKAKLNFPEDVVE